MTEWKEAVPILLGAHQTLDGGLDFVVEGECSKYPNMKQALKIGAENARRTRNCKPLLDHTAIRPEPPDGGNWEDFCTGPVPAEELLCMDAAERKAVAEMRERLSEKVLVHF